MTSRVESSVPILDLSWASDPAKRPELLAQLHLALFDVGFLYIVNHGVPQSTVNNLTALLPALFGLPDEEKLLLSKLNNAHFLGYSGFAEETTLGKRDQREQFDFATELPEVFDDSKEFRGGSRQNGAGAPHPCGRDFSKLYWQLRGPNQWPSEASVPGFREAFIDYHDALQELSCRFVYLVEEAFDIPSGTFDQFFGLQHLHDGKHRTSQLRDFLPPQHRIKLLRYPPSSEHPEGQQGVGAHKDSSGWLTFLHQVGNEPGLEVLSSTGVWLPVAPIDHSFVVNFGNAFEAATEGAVKATVHRVIAPGPTSNVRFSIPFFQGLPLDMTLSEIRGFIPEQVRQMRKRVDRNDESISSFLDPRWDSLGESQLRKWIRSHKEVALKHYGQKAVDYYTAADPPAQA